MSQAQRQTIAESARRARTADELADLGAMVLDAMCEEDPWPIWWPQSYQPTVAGMQFISATGPWREDRGVVVRNRIARVLRSYVVYPR